MTIPGHMVRDMLDARKALNPRRATGKVSRSGIPIFMKMLYFYGVAQVEGSGDRIIRTVTSVLHTSWQVRTHYESASPEEAEFLIARLNDKELQRIVDLLAQSLEVAASDDLGSFLFGWTALEIFINIFFSQYERAFVDAVTSETSVHGTSRYFECVTEVMKGKYRLVDKFGVVAAALTGETSDADIDRLKCIKKVRDELLHGQDAPVTSLVNTELRELLSTYLLAHLTRSSL